MKGLILAAGVGRRLEPVTRYTPKPLLPILHRPCIEPLIELLVAAGIRDLAINRHHLPDQIISRLGDGRRWGVRITYSYEPELLAAMGTLKSLADFFAQEPVVMVNGDIVIDLDLPALIRFHQEQKAIATMALKLVPGPLPAPVGQDATGRMRQIRGVPAWNGEPLQEGVNVGVNLFEPQVWQEYVPAGVPYDLATQLYPDLLRHREPVFCFPVEGYWADIGTPEGYLQAHFDLLAQPVSRYFKGLEEWESGVWVGQGVRLSPGAVVQPPAVLADGCVIESEAQIGPYAVLGLGCRVELEAAVSWAVVWPGLTVPAGETVRGQWYHPWTALGSED